MSWNLLDVLMGCIILRCIYIGAARGIVVELFKLIGIVFSIFIVLHYYVPFGQFWHNNFSLPLEAGELISFVIIWLLVTVLFKIIREGWMLVFKKEPHPHVNKLGGALLGVFRGVLVCSLSFLLIYLSGHLTLMRSAKSSFLGMHLSDVAPGIYKASFDGIVSEMFPEEKKNIKVFKLKEFEKKVKK